MYTLYTLLHIRTSLALSLSLSFSLARWLAGSLHTREVSVSMILGLLLGDDFCDPLPSSSFSLFPT